MFSIDFESLEYKLQFNVFIACLNLVSNYLLKIRMPYDHHTHALKKKNLTFYHHFKWVHVTASGVTFLSLKIKRKILWVRQTFSVWIGRNRISLSIATLFSRT